MPELSIITCSPSWTNSSNAALLLWGSFHACTAIKRVVFFCLFAPLSTMMDPSGVFNSADYLDISNVFVFCTQTHVTRQNCAD